MKEEYEIFKDVVPANWKQENLLLNTVKDKGFQRDWHDQTLENAEIAAQILKTISEVMGERESLFDDLEHNYYYFSKENEIDLGTVIGFQNAKLRSLEYHNKNHFYDVVDHVTLHIEFEVENPFQSQIDEIDKELNGDKFKNATKEEWENKLGKEWEALSDKKRKINPYLPNFTYVYLYDLSTDKVNEIIETLKKPEIKAYAQAAIDVKIALVQYRGKEVSKLPYNELLDYWDLYDSYNDYTSGITPSDKELQHRKSRREVSEADYYEKSRKQIEMFDSFMLD